MSDPAMNKKRTGEMADRPAKRQKVGKWYLSSEAPRKKKPPNVLVPRNNRQVLILEIY